MWNLQISIWKISIIKKKYTDFKFCDTKINLFFYSISHELFEALLYIISVNSYCLNEKENHNSRIHQISFPRWSLFSPFYYKKQNKIFQQFPKVFPKLTFAFQNGPISMHYFYNILMISNFPLETVKSFKINLLHEIFHSSNIQIFTLSTYKTASCKTTKKFLAL